MTISRVSNVYVYVTENDDILVFISNDVQDSIQKRVGQDDGERYIDPMIVFLLLAERNDVSNSKNTDSTLEHEKYRSWRRRYD